MHNYTMQEKIPRTRELRSMVLAMNRMTEKVQATFAEQAGTAPTTAGDGLPRSTHRFGVIGAISQNQLQTRLASPEDSSSGALFLNN